MNTGIYSIEHLASGKKYIGSAVNFAARWRAHRSDLRLGKHHSAYLQNGRNKYGEDAFEFKKLLVCSKENLLMYEQLCIDGYETVSHDKGYNMSPTAGSTLGVYPSEGTKAKQRASKRLTHSSPEVRAKLRAAQLGRKLSAITCARMSAARKGVPRPISVSAKCSMECLKEGPTKEITPVIIASIKERRAANFTDRSSATLYGLSNTTVNRIINDKHWGCRQPTKEI